MRCVSCHGIVGKDCFNPQECAEIAAQQEEDSREEYYERASSLERRLEYLENLLKDQKESETINSLK